MRNHNKPLLTTLAVGSLTLGASLFSLAPAQASLLGDTINYTLAFPNFFQFDAGSFVVSNGGPEVNFTGLGSGTAVTVDFGGSSFDLGFDLGSFGFIGDNVAWTFTDLNWTDSPGVITGVTQTGGPTAVSRQFIHLLLLPPNPVPY